MVFGVRLVNDTPAAVRVRRVDIVTTRGGEPLSRRTLDRFFSNAAFPRANVVSRGSQEDWGGICVDGLEEEADGLVVELDLSSRDGIRARRRSESLRVALSPHGAGPLLRLPFRGPWRVTQGHACGESHRHGALGGEFAWDFVALDREGRASVPSHEAGRSNRDSLTFGREVASPVAGRVVKVRDGVADNEGLVEFPRKSLLENLRAPDWVYGNYLVIEAGNGAWVLLGHLQRESIRVKPGDAVRAGTVVALAGNSGNSILPHLHLQVMDRQDPADPEVSGIPAEIADYLEVTASAGGAAKEILARRRARGDPPRDAVVSPTDPGSP